MRGWYAKGSLVIIAVIFGCSYLACKKDGNGTGTTFDFTWVGEQNLNSPITFHSNAPVGSTYLWEFGDSTQSTNSAPQHVYSSGIVYPTDTFTVTLTVNKNSFRSVVKKIVIGPLLDFTFNGLPMVGSTISFQSTALAGSNFLWSFGDGITSTAPTPSHVYSSAGSYNTSLTINSDTAHSVKEIAQIFADPLYTHLISGLRNWHHQLISTAFPGNIYYYDDTSFVVNYFDPLTISIGHSTLMYSSATGNTLNYYGALTSGGIYPTGDYDEVNFNYVSGTVAYTLFEHHSAGDNRTETYTSY